MQPLMPIVGPSCSPTSSCRNSTASLPSAWVVNFGWCSAADLTIGVESPSKMSIRRVGKVFSTARERRRKVCPPHLALVGTARGGGANSSEQAPLPALHPPPREMFRVERVAQPVAEQIEPEDG